MERFTIDAIRVVADEIFGQISAGHLSVAVQKSIRESLTETITKGVISVFLHLKGSRYVSEAARTCNSGAELIESLVARDPKLSDAGFAALAHCREEILHEISSRIATAVGAGVL